MARTYIGYTLLTFIYEHLDSSRYRLTLHEPTTRPSSTSVLVELHVTCMPVVILLHLNVVDMCNYG